MSETTQLTNNCTIEFLFKTFKNKQKDINIILNMINTAHHISLNIKFLIKQKRNDINVISSNS